MDAIIRTIRDALLGFGTWELNGLLAILYTVWEHGAALAAAGAFVALLFWTPPGRRSAHPVRDQLSGQRPGLLGIGVAVVLAAVPGAGAHAGAAGRHDDCRDSGGGPRPLQPGRAAVAGGRRAGALCAGRAGAPGLCPLPGRCRMPRPGPRRSVDRARPRRAGAGAGLREHAGDLGLWLILPLGYLSLLAQGVLVHPPLPATPEQVITAVRTRRQSRHLSKQSAGAGSLKCREPPQPIAWRHSGWLSRNGVCIRRSGLYMQIYSVRGRRELTPRLRPMACTSGCRRRSRAAT